MVRSLILARLCSQAVMSRKIVAPSSRMMIQTFSTTTDGTKMTSNVVMSHTSSTQSSSTTSTTTTKDMDTSKVVLTKTSADIDDLDDDDDDLEEGFEAMFVEADPSFEFAGKEWGGPRRGGKLPEPTRYGDWERKGRCSDF